MMRELSIVCFAGCDWWYHNRGLFVPQVMRRLAKNRRVLFVNSIGMRVPSLKGDRDAHKKIVRKLRSIARYLCKDASGMHIFSPFSLPFRSEEGKMFNRTILRWQLNIVFNSLGIQRPVYYIGCPPAWEVVKEWPRSFLIYERTDPFAEMQGIDKLYISRLDDELSATADLVLYVNSAMWEEGRKRNPNSLLLGHGVDYTYFADACISDTVPEDIATIGHPVVGFFGDITEDVCDFSLLGYVAEKMPDVSIVLVGPISSDLSSLRKYSNLHFLGQKPYDVIAHYGKMFDVAIMPWKRNKWIEFCNPVKTKEYLALGKPIVSIDYPELRPFHDLVYPASDYDGFVQAIRRALGEDDETLVQKRRERVQHETWDDKVGQIEEFISKNVQRKNSDK